MPNVNRLTVLYRGEEVGTLARSRDGRFPFEYENAWIEQGFSLNPLSLPLEKRVFMPAQYPLNGMFGVFEDSLPDGWGRLLVDRTLQAARIDPNEVDGISRLAIVGSSGMGALEYQPTWDLSQQASPHIDLDILAKECARVLGDKEAKDLDMLFVLGGSSGGARPKILTEIDDADWIIKFPSSYDSSDIGKQEYDYALCAKNCNIDMPEARLFPSKKHAGYFGVKRFDRNKCKEGIHMVSAAGMLETTHRTPNLDYLDLMKLTISLTKSHAQIKQLFKRMCFNVFSYNRDDHAKNFSFLFDDVTHSWKLSPAYDLTYSSSINGEHATTVAGNGINPQLDDIMTIAKEFELSPSWARETAYEIREKTMPLLKKYRPSR